MQNSSLWYCEHPNPESIAIPDKKNKNVIARGSRKDEAELCMT